MPRAEETRKSLAALGLLDRRLRIIRTGDEVILPVTGFPEQDFPGSRCTADFDEARVRKNYRDFITLPAELKRHLPSSFDIIGRKALLKVPPELKDHEMDLGSAILQAHPSLDTVFADGGVAGDFRIRRLRCIAGAGGTETELTEYGMRLKVDVSKTFYSPRLASERRRVCSTISQEEQILDMFAGVGPFSIQAGMRAVRGRVVSIDINPYAVSYLKENAEANGVGNIEAHLRDAAEYSEGCFDRIIMNLPSGGSRYLAHAAALLAGGGRIDYYELLDNSALQSRTAEMKEEGIQMLEARLVKSYSPSQGIYHFALTKIIS